MMLLIQRGDPTTSDRPVCFTASIARLPGCEMQELLSVLVSKLSNHGLYFLNWYCYIINKISQFGFDQTHSSVLSLIDNSLCPVPVSRNKIATDQRSLWFIDSMSLKSPSKAIISLIFNKGMRLICGGVGFYMRKYSVIQPKVSF